MVVFILIQILMDYSVSNFGDLDQTPHLAAASGLGLYCLPMPHKKGTRLKWVKSAYQKFDFLISKP